ncbi:hypothetical protein ES708_14391 [subsurface metagenome]
MKTDALFKFLIEAVMELSHVGPVEAVTIIKGKLDEALNALNAEGA